MNTRTYEIVPIPPEQADDLRIQGGEVYVADAVPGFPCRQCLRDAEIGEELILVSHDPFRLTSPYRSASPIFIHRIPCEQPDGGPDMPVQLTRRRLSVRSFDEAEMMLDAAVIDGRELDETIRRFFSDDRADRIHIHNADRGCWAATAELGQRVDR